MWAEDQYTYYATVSVQWFEFHELNACQVENNERDIQLCYIIAVLTVEYWDKQVRLDVHIKCFFASNEAEILELASLG